MLANLNDLPPEIVYQILALSGSPSLSLTSRRLNSICRGAPNIVKVHYLLRRWHQAYPYWSKRSAPRSDSAPSNPDLVDYLDWDQVWPAKFIPPIAALMQDGVGIHILDMALEHPICNHRVLAMLEQHILSSTPYGNIVASIGIYREDKGDEQEMPSHKASFFPVRSLPKRLFNGKSVASTYLPEYDADAGLLDPRQDGVESQFLRYHLSVFGPASEQPAAADLFVLLRTLLLHPNISDKEDAESNVNSHDGYPLVKSVYLRSTFLVSLLLACGASAEMKDGLCIKTAIRSDWLEGLRLLSETSRAQTKRWKRSKRALRAWMVGGEDRQLELERWIQDEQQRTADGNDRNAVHDDDDNGWHAGDTVRNRVSLKDSHLSLAVRSSSRRVRDYLQQVRMVAPGIKTIRAIEEMDALAASKAPQKKDRHGSKAECRGKDRVAPRNDRSSQSQTEDDKERKQGNKARIVPGEDLRPTKTAKR